MKGRGRYAVTTRPSAYLDTSIAAQFEENKACGCVGKDVATHSAVVPDKRTK
jgi:hypothetical protein